MNMSSPFRLKLFTALFVGGAVVQVAASTAPGAESRHHEPHVHGVARLNAAVQENRLYLEFLSPAMNIVGFEHEPSTAAQKERVDEAKHLLEDGARMFAPEAAAHCRLTAVNVDSDIDRGTMAARTDTGHEHADEARREGGADDHEHDHDGEQADAAHHGGGQEDHDHDHDGEHADAVNHEGGEKSHDHGHDGGHADAAQHGSEADGHDHGHGGHDDEYGRHSDFTATYEFVCEHPEKLSQIDVMLLQEFPGIERIEVQLVAPGGQTAVELSPDNQSIAL